MLRCSSICLLLFVAACGDDGGSNHPPDAPIGEGSDAPGPDAPPATGSVNILATSRSDSGLAPGTPIQGVIVVALKKDGSLAGTATTAANGTASITGLNDGVSVTAVYPVTDDDHNVVTYVDVKVGDTLTFGDKYYSGAASGTEGTLNISWAPVTNATSYRVLHSCNAYSGDYFEGTSGTLNLSSYCQTATTPLVVKAYDNGGLLASIHVASTASTPGTTLDLTAEPWVAVTTGNFTVGVTGLSAVTSYLNFDTYADYHGLTVEDYRNADITSAAASATLTVPAADSLTAYARLQRDGDYGQQFSYKRGASPIALTAPTQPWVAGLVVSSTQGVWLPTTGSTYDTALLQLEWQHYVLDGGKGSDGHYEYWNWNIILPPNVTSFSFPTPPPQLAAELPTDSDEIDSHLELIDLSSTADYDAVRAIPEYRLTDLLAAVRAGDEPSVTSSTADGGEGFGFARVTGSIKQQLSHSRLGGLRRPAKRSH